MDDSTLVICPWCRLTNEISRFCTTCAGPLVCPSCQSPITRQIKHCTHCGAKITRHPANNSLRNLYDSLGRALYERGRYKDAIAAFEQALTEEDTQYDTWRIRANLSTAQERAGEAQIALRGYLTALEEAPQHATLLLRYAHHLLTPSLSRAERDRLRNVSKALSARDNLSPEARAEIAIFMGRASLNLSDYDEAMRLFEQARAIVPDDPRAQEGLGEALWQSGALDDAIKALSTAHEIASSGKHPERLIPIHVKLAQVLAAAGRYEAALACVGDLTRSNHPHRAELLTVRAQSLLALGRVDEALAAAEDAGRVANSVAPHLLRAQVLIRLKRYADAVGAANDALQFDPAHATVIFYKIQALVEGQIDLDQAQRLLANCAESLGIEKLVQQIESPELSTRKNDGNARFFIAYVYTFLSEKDQPAAFERALEEVNAALDLGPTDISAGHPRAPVYQLKASLLARQLARELEVGADVWCWLAEGHAAYEGVWEDVWLCLYEAGRRFLWRAEHPPARQLLEAAIGLRPDYAAQYWYLAETYRMLSIRPEPPYVDKDTIQKSIDTWSAGVARQLPDADFAWAYNVRALINELLARLPGQPRVDLWWESIVWIERGLVLDPVDAYRWCDLGRYHRGLENWANALAATAQALEDESGNSEAVEERIITLTNAGLFDEAEHVVAMREEQRRDVWLDAIRAYIQSRRGNYEDALRLITPALETGPEGLYWYYEVRALCRRMLGDRESAQADNLAILSKYNRLDRDNLASFGRAAYRLGKLREAIDILEPLRDEPSEASNALTLLGLCAIVQGRIDDGTQLLIDGIERMKNKRDLDDFMKFDLVDVADAAARTPRLRDAYDRVLETARRRRAQLAELPPIEDELRAIVADCERNGQVSTLAWVGAQAGLARIYAEQARWGDAAAIYVDLQQAGAAFPEAAIGLRKNIDQLRDAADQCLQEGDADKAMVHLRAALDLAQNSLADDLSTQADLLSQVGFAYFTLNDERRACAEFGAALARYRSCQTPSPGEALATILRALLRSTAQYWSLSSALTTFANDTATDLRLRDDFIAASRALSPFLDTLFRLAKQPDESLILPIVTPIYLELGDGLIPEDTSDNWSLFKFYIPEMRNRIERETGVTLPGVRVRQNSYDPRDSYNIQLDEIPLVRDHVQLDKRYSPTTVASLTAEGIPSAQLIEALNPMTGVPGSWVPQAFWDAVRSNGHQLWEEPIVYCIYHLEAVLRRSLAYFVDIETTEAMLQVLAQTERGAALIAATLPDAAARLRLCQVLRALVRERVPIRHLEAIIEAIQGVSGAQIDVAAAVRAARARLRVDLPGNRFGDRRLEIPLEWEEQLLSSTNRDAIVTTSPHQSHLYLTELREWMRDESWNTVLVVQNPTLRPLVRRLIEGEFPDLMVLSREEQLSPEQALRAFELKTQHLDQGAGVHAT